MIIKDIPKEERPRERMINYGVEYLSNEELLAILFKTGTKFENVKTLSQRVLKEVNNIEELKNITYEQLSNISGIGDAKACTLLASIELGKRMNTKPIIREQFNSPELVFNYYKNILGNKKQEHFCCIYLDTKKQIIRDKIVFVGTINSSPVHPREIFKEAYLLSASSIICVHNHPSGDITPSREDIYTTERLKEVGKLLGIPIIDHIIISNNDYYSFNERGDI